MKLSVAVPYHDTPKTAFFLSRLLKSLDEQTFKDFEIVLTKEPGMAHNHNSAILKSKGELIKLMQMDDYFAHPNALKDIVENFKPEDTWMISACTHTLDGVNQIRPHYPFWNDEMYLGNNTLGSVSTLTLRKGVALFDETVSWFLDVELYDRLYKKFGMPRFLNNPNVVIAWHEGQQTNLLSDEVKQRDLEYVSHKVKI